MNQELRFGIGILQYLPWKKEVERWQFIEALGFDSVRVGDHFVNWMQPEAPWYEAWTLLAALASQTTRIRIGPMVTPIAFRNPAILARQALTVIISQMVVWNLVLAQERPAREIVPIQ